MLKKSKYPYYRPAKKGMAWARKVYKKMLINQCQCGKLMVNRTVKQKCDECKEREWRESRLRSCSACGANFMLHDHQHGGERICEACREQDWKFLFRRISDFVLHTDEYFGNLPLDRKIHRFALKSRNDIQAVTDYRNFKMYHFKFQNNNQKTPTMDHINAMTHIIEYFIRGYFSGKYKLDYDVFREYLLKYAVQFPVTQRDNLALREFQARGIKPEEYVEVAGPLEDHTHEETIEAIREHFIHG